MGFIKDIPPLKGDNYNEWKKKIDLAFVLVEVDWVVTTPCLTEPVAPVRETNESDADWQKKESDHAPIHMAYDLQKQKWFNANKKCVVVIKNTIEPTIMGSIQECDTVTEYLERIKCQFYGSSKTCYSADKAADDRKIHWRWQWHWHKRAHIKVESFEQ
jgi:hypothetical protein